MDIAIGGFARQGRNVPIGGLRVRHFSEKVWIRWVNNAKDFERVSS